MSHKIGTVKKTIGSILRLGVAPASVAAGFLGTRFGPASKLGDMGKASAQAAITGAVGDALSQGVNALQRRNLMGGVPQKKNVRTMMMMMMNVIYNYIVKAAAGCIPGGNNYSSQTARAR